jgi:hypothetical protein
MMSPDVHLGAGAGLLLGPAQQRRVVFAYFIEDRLDPR